MKKEAGKLTGPEMVFVLLGAVVTFIIATVVAYSALVYWNVH